MVEENKPKKENTATKTVVVKDLPTQSFNNFKDEKGQEFNLLTIEEALSIILEKVTSIDKQIGMR